MMKKTRDKVLDDQNTDHDNQEVVGDMKGELVELMQVRPEKIFDRRLNET